MSTLAFSKDSKTLASCDSDKTIILWDVKTRQPLGTPLTGPVDSVWSVAFSLDGQTLASGGSEENIYLWDVRTRRRLGPPLKATRIDTVNSVAFSPDGKILASGSLDRTIIFWDVDVRSWIRRVCQVANRNLTREEWRRYMGDRPYRKTIPNLPGPED